MHPSLAEKGIPEVKEKVRRGCLLESADFDVVGGQFGLGGQLVADLHDPVDPLSRQLLSGHSDKPATSTRVI